MKEFFEKAILLINQLIQTRTNQCSILIQLNRSKETTALKFKIKNYNNWIGIIKEHITNNTQIVDKNDITKIKLTDKLSSNLIDLLENGKFKDIDLAMAELKEIEKLINTTNPEPQVGSQSASQSVSTQYTVDTTKIEAQPKHIDGKVRPRDKRGGDIHDLCYIHDIGEKTAMKYVDNGVTLAGLLEEWDKWSSKNPTNAILLPSKMPRPSEYTDKQWAALTDDSKHAIQENNLKRKIANETKLLHFLKGASIVGVKHFHNMSPKIPREEIDRANKILQKLGSHMNKDLKVVLCGSYRRERAKSGDIDCLILHPSVRTQQDLDVSTTYILANFVKLLIDTNFVVDQLTMGPKKFMGFCVVPQKKAGKGQVSQEDLAPIPRRIDIRFVPYDSYGAAVLYFTGSMKFNTDMRIHALKKGYSLNEFGLKRVSDNVLLTFPTEEEIFTFLQYPYKTPKERDI